ncbi:MAG: tRNA 2-selenouridine(34) synthase MnmH [Deferribacteres bacterium]|nr:tRNA 2-selenouridine(34) synthase MnmH [candidate division KSB1 bacterium]MCB9500402.1 tRNA 2-selenouridine(34) synthase MnmH [Deferribacteres bacterium]
MPQVLPIEKFLQQSEAQPIFDVRSPAEFQHGRIPGAKNLPLFSDEERAEVGTLYKRKGREQAMLRGLEIVGPKMMGFVEFAKEHCSNRQVFLHCWRGGQRSESMAWLLEFSGLHCFVLEGGYKSFRRFVREGFTQEKQIVILGGMTGTGKTEILLELAKLGEKIIDLEDLAIHKGSAFGGIERPQDITQEHFENRLGLAWRKIDPQKLLWLEDESQRIGNVHVPMEIWQQMKAGPVLAVEMPADLRQKRLLLEYAELNPDELKKATQRIERRLGGLATKQTLEALDAGDMEQACAILLPYYDKFYTRGLVRREDDQVLQVGTNTIDAAENAVLVRDFWYAKK